MRPCLFSVYCFRSFVQFPSLAFSKRRFELRLDSSRLFEVMQAGADAAPANTNGQMPKAVFGEGIEAWFTAFRLGAIPERAKTGIITAMDNAALLTIQRSM